MSSSCVRRTGALLLVTALVTGGLAVATPTPAIAGPVAAPAPLTPAAAGARWLSGQLTDGLVVGEWGPDHGLSIDVALALDAVGSGAAVQGVADAVAAEVASYVSGEAFGDEGSAYAGATAKAAVLALAADRDPRRFGGRDLVAELESVTTDSGPATGRIVDRSTFGDYANTLGQAYAVRALEAARSSEAVAATAYLLDQQCAAGFFRLELGTVEARDQTCDGAPDAEADTDVTALAVLSLLPQRDDEDVRPHLTSALDWLRRNQRGDGSFGGGVATEAANANSTGLAGWALGEAGRTKAAARAAGWVRGLQLAHTGACAPYRAGDLGAIAYDVAGLDTVTASGVAELRDQVRRASAQALPALTWAPGRVDAFPVPPMAPPRFHRAGTRVSVRLGPLAPGEPVCVTMAGTRRQVRADQAGAATALIKLPARTATYAVRAVAPSGTLKPVPSRLRTLAATSPVLRVGARLTRGRTVQVRVRGLAAREPALLRFRGTVVARGTSNAAGRWTPRVRVTGKAGQARLVVRGAFADRTRSVTVRVVR
ncbi:cell wall anchor protein [Nocardioides sp. zg-DK7169]|uniref:cell wall anchor protein n=1 Tax=Nocardioides sp. zg-DK7169 TaxID=2736600 RepID=UPI0015546B1E|nr:cell wall anchor protein [Nocardioides sp. zg-DK7169]NPC95656.1 cell wall anchor protein [Nocardioides sp. zg-DK7169]